MNGYVNTCWMSDGCMAAQHEFHLINQNLNSSISCELFMRQGYREEHLHRFSRFLCDYILYSACRANTIQIRQWFAVSLPLCPTNSITPQIKEEKQPVATAVAPPPALSAVPGGFLKQLVRDSEKETKHKEPEVKEEKPVSAFVFVFGSRSDLAKLPQEPCNLSGVVMPPAGGTHEFCDYDHIRLQAMMDDPSPYKLGWGPIVKLA